MAEQFSAQIIPFPRRVPAAVTQNDATDLQLALAAQHLAIQKWNHALADLNFTMTTLHQQSGNRIV